MHSFQHLDAALPGLTASEVIFACSSACSTLGLGLDRTVSAVLAQGLSRAEGRDYDAARSFILSFIAPIQLDDVTRDIDRSHLGDCLRAARLTAEAVLAVRQSKSRLNIEV